MTTHQYARGSRREVMSGTAKKTSGGLTRKKLRYRTKSGTRRIVSRRKSKQAKRRSKKKNSWISCVNDARKQLKRERVIKSGEFIPVLKSVRRGRKIRGKVMSIKDQRKGVELYKLAKDYYGY